MFVLELTGPTTFARRGLKAVPLHSGLLRVTRLDGTVLGYLEPLDEPQGERFRVKRMRMREQFGRFLILGEFWSLDEALDCLLQP